MNFKKSYLIHLGLFIATLLTTTFVGTISYFQFINYDKQILNAQHLKLYLLNPQNYLYGFLYFSFPMLFVLFAHEMGHYLMCRRYKINATLPYFIPAPTIVGTFGAVIKIKEPIYSKKPLFDIGIAGPIMSFFLSIPVLIYGISLSKIIPPMKEGGLGLGEPLIFKFISSIFFSNLPENKDILIHPLGFAGWFGILVTFFNLFPLGQLDGGHIFFSVSPSLHKKLSYIFIGFLLVCGIIYWPGWIVWGVLIYILGIKHPPVYDMHQPLDSKRKLLFLLIIIIFILSFTLQPVYFEG